MNPTLCLPGFQNAPVGSSRSGAQIFSFLEKEEQEVLAAGFLDAANGLIGTREIFRGTIRECVAQPREILREALKANAAQLLVAHNHVSSQLLPSDEDLKFTARLEWAAETLGIPLIDHFIIGSGGRYFSFAEARLLRTGAPLLRKRAGRRRGNPSRYS